MPSNLKTENINDYQISTCKNSVGKVFYLYEDKNFIMKSGKREHIYTWQPEKPGSQDRGLTPCTIPSGFELIE